MPRPPRVVPEHLRQRAPGAGTKPPGYVTPQERLDFEAARARNEAAKADLNELELAVKRGEYVLRAEVREATATAWAACAQSLRSVPDNIERKLGVSPEVAQEVGYLIDAALDTVAAKFEEMAHQAAAVEAAGPDGDEHADLL